MKQLLKSTLRSCFFMFLSKYEIEQYVFVFSIVKIRYLFDF